jgi:formylglycine-generating enzyme required for sulfatase activity
MKIFFLLLFLSTLSLLAQTTETLITPLKIPMVFVGDPGNRPDTASGGRGLGAVQQSFLIGKYEITAGQYCAFLNAVASHGDPHHLYKPEMGSDPQVACITLTQLSEEVLSYNLINGRELLPISYVTLRDAQRFCNWLDSGAPSSQDDPALLAASTESGAYLITEQDGEERVEFNSNALYFLPTESQWIKAAYYKGEGVDSGYWSYPTQHNSAPNSGHGDATNQANYQTLATHWSAPEKDLALTPVDRFSKTSSFYGTCDMGGNVAEWTCHLTEESDLASMKARPEIVRGGSWRSEYSIYWNSELMRTATPLSHDPWTANSHIGFRIAAALPELPDRSMPSDKKPSNSSFINAKETSVQIAWKLIRSSIGCGMCLLGALFTILKNLGATLRINTGFLETIESLFTDLQLSGLTGELPAWLASYVPAWLIYRLVPLVIELGFFAVFLVACYELSYYWPVLKEGVIQLCYAL